MIWCVIGITCGCILQISQNCAFYSLKGYVSESNPFAVNSTSIFLAAGGNILDACGSPFNVTVTRVEQSHRYLLSLAHTYTHIHMHTHAHTLVSHSSIALTLLQPQPVLTDAVHKHRASSCTLFAVLDHTLYRITSGLGMYKCIPWSVLLASCV